MNEFTQEELKAILYDLERNENPWQCGNTIINKIQSMIDNYCEHKWAFYISPHGNIVRCDECNKSIPE